MNKRALHYQVATSISRNSFIYWYSLALILIAQGLGIILFQKSLGSPINWIGRSFQYLGGIYFLIALVKGFTEASGRGTSFVEMLPVLVDAAHLRKAEEALHRSEAKYRRLFENIQEMVTVHEVERDDRGRIVERGLLDGNPAFLRAVGASSIDEIRGKTSSHVFGKSWSKDHLPTVQEAMDHGETRIQEVYRPESRRYYITSIVPLDADTYIGTGWDITERKKSEESLRESEAKFRSLFESMSEGVALHEIIFDQSGAAKDYRILDVNPAFEKHTGMSGEKAPGQLASFFYDASPPPYLDVYSRTAISGEPHTFETYYPQLDRHFHVSVSSPRQGQFVTVFEDITEHRQMEDEPRRSESEFKLLSETASSLLASDNPQGIVNELCRSVMAHLDCHAFFNFIVEESVGKLRLNAFAGIPEEEAEKIEWLDFGVAVCGCAARTGVRIVAEDIFNTPDIRTDLVRSYGIQAYGCHPLMIGGKVIGTLSFGTRTRSTFSPRELAVMKTVANQVAVAMERIWFIERLRKSRDELELRVRERTAELERSNQALQDFASIDSHDLQEPLRKVQSFGNMLRQKWRDSLGETGNDYLNRMLDATGRMQSLLNSLLEYSRVTNKQEPFQGVDLYDIVHEVLSDLEVRIRKSNGEVHVGKLPAVGADPTQMRQLFQNIIGNALKFHKDGEKPIIHVRCTDSDGGNCRIEVEDNGIGFEEEYLDKIFAPFKRLHGKSSPYEGTGMGLAICKKIVERHEGTISAKSVPGKGSTFIIRLPIKQSG